MGYFNTNLAFFITIVGFVDFTMQIPSHEYSDKMGYYNGNTK